MYLNQYLTMLTLFCSFSIFLFYRRLLPSVCTMHKNWSFFFLFCFPILSSSIWSMTQFRFTGLLLWIVQLVWSHSITFPVVFARIYVLMGFRIMRTLGFLSSTLQSTLPGTLSRAHLRHVNLPGDFAFVRQFVVRTLRNLNSSHSYKPSSLTANSFIKTPQIPHLTTLTSQSNTQIGNL